MTDIVFANRDNPIVPDSAIIHDNESFRLQWSALNTSDKDVAAFVGRLVITSIPEGCPGSDDREHEIVFDRDVGGIRGRGAGRLVITLKPMPSRVTAEWMAQQWRDGKRIKKKLGNYPSMSLAQAREVFNRD